MQKRPLTLEQWATNIRQVIAKIPLNMFLKVVKINSNGTKFAKIYKKFEASNFIRKKECHKKNYIYFRNRQYYKGSQKSLVIQITKECDIDFHYKVQREKFIFYKSRKRMKWERKRETNAER